MKNIDWNEPVEHFDIHTGTWSVAAILTKNFYKSAADMASNKKSYLMWITSNGKHETRVLSPDSKVSNYWRNPPKKHKRKFGTVVLKGKMNDNIFSVSYFEGQQGNYHSKEEVVDAYHTCTVLDFVEKEIEIYE